MREPPQPTPKDQLRGLNAQLRALHAAPLIRDEFIEDIPAKDVPGFVDMTTRHLALVLKLIRELEL